MFQTQRLENVLIVNTYDDAYLLYDGEIYNHTELVSKYFSNTGFKTKSDTELLYNILNERYDLLDKIEGIFAFVFYNKNQIIYARDPIYVKNLLFKFNNYKNFALSRNYKYFLNLLT